jgi:hypothetical protein
MPNNNYRNYQGAAGGGPGSREPAGVRLRVASHGPQLRNVNGDSHSLLEEDIYD